MRLPTCALLVWFLGLQACVNASLDGRVAGLVFNVKSLALRSFGTEFSVSNPNGLLPEIPVTEWVAVFSDQDTLCADMQAHILRKNSKQLQIALGQVNLGGLALDPSEDTHYKALDIATLAFSSDSVGLPISTFRDGFSLAELFVVDENCNAPLLPERASSGGSVTVSRWDGAALLADFDLRMGPQADRIQGGFLAPLCPIPAIRPAASCR